MRPNPKARTTRPGARCGADRGRNGTYSTLLTQLETASTGHRPSIDSVQTMIALRYQAIALMNVPLEDDTGLNAVPRSSGGAPGGPRLEQRSRTRHGRVAGKVDPAKRALGVASRGGLAVSALHQALGEGRGHPDDSECEPRRCASSTHV